MIIFDRCHHSEAVRRESFFVYPDIIPQKTGFVKGLNAIFSEKIVNFSASHPYDTGVYALFTVRKLLPTRKITKYPITL